MSTAASVRDPVIRVRLRAPGRIALPAFDKAADERKPRAAWRSARNGEMNDTNTMRPASTINFATSATRRIFSLRSSKQEIA